MVEIKPQWPKGYSRVGAAALGMGDIERAKAAYEKGVLLCLPGLSISQQMSLSKVSNTVVRGSGQCWGLESILVQSSPGHSEAVVNRYERRFLVHPGRGQDARYAAQSLHATSLDCAGLEVDPENEGFKTELENLKAPPRRGGPGGGGGLFGPEFLGKLATNPQTASLLAQPDFLQMMRDVNANPNNMSKWAP